MFPTNLHSVGGIQGAKMVFRRAAEGCKSRMYSDSGQWNIKKLGKLHKSHLFLRGVNFLLIFFVKHYCRHKPVDIFFKGQLINAPKVVTVSFFWTPDLAASQCQPRSQGLFPRLVVLAVIWVSPCFRYPRTQIPSVLGNPKH